MSLGVDESMWVAAMGDPIGIGPPHPEEGKAGTSSQSQSQSQSQRKRHTKSCSNCKQLGHNKKTCQRSPVASSVRGKGRGTGTGRGMGQANHVKGMKRGTGRGPGNANAITSMVSLQMGGGRAAAPGRDATVEIPTTQASGIGTGSSAVCTSGFDVPTQSSGVVGSSTRDKGISVWVAF